MTELLRVPFHGAGSGVDALSWGQQVMWDAMVSKRTWMPIGTVAPIPPGMTMADVADELRFLMRHYPTLRTRIQPDRPAQVVADSGELAIEIVDTDDDPAGVAEQIRLRYWYADYDAEHEWPIRVAVVRCRGVLTHRVWVMCHLVTDGAGVRIMIDELGRRDATGSGAAMSTLAQAEWQRSPAGQRQSEMALRHWQRLLRTVAPERFPNRPEPCQPRYWNGGSSSQEMLHAVRALARQTGTDTGPVVLALFALSLAQVTGIGSVATKVTVGNRFRPELARTVSPIVHNGLIALEVAGVSVAEAVAQARRRSLPTYKYAYYDPRRLDDLLARVSRERGEEIELGCFFNHRTRATGAVPARPPGFRWEERRDDTAYDPLFVTVDELPDTMSVLVYIDTRFISPADAGRCVRGMAELAVAAAPDPELVAV